MLGFVDLARLLLDHPYVWLVLAVLVEGPVATIVAGTLIATGTIDWWPALGLAFAADCLVDSLWFLLGRAGAPTPGTLRARLLGRCGVSPERFAGFRQNSHRRLPLLVGGAKLADVAAVPTFVALGASGVAYRRFLGWVSSLTVLKSALLLALGWALARGFLPTGTTPVRAALLGLLVSLGLGVTVLMTSFVLRRARSRRPSTAGKGG